MILILIGIIFTFIGLFYLTFDLFVDGEKGNSGLASALFFIAAIMCFK